TVKLYTNAGCTGTAAASGSAETFASPGLVVSVKASEEKTFWATATDVASDVSSCSATSLTYKNTASEILIEGSELDDFFIQQCEPGRVDEVPDPLGRGKMVMSFEPPPEDVVENPECEPGGAATENPRAWAVSEDNIEDGAEFWLRARFLIPNSFPLIEGNSWITLIDVYGPPFEGPAPWNFQVKPLTIGESFEGDVFMHQRNETYEWDIPWFSEFVTGKWDEVVLHEKFSESGYVEEWFNGVKEKYFVPELELWNPMGEPESEKLEMATRDFTNDGAPNSVRIGQYRKA